MAATHLNKELIVDALRSAWSGFDRLLEVLADDQWEAPVPVPAWDVRAAVAHVIGTESMLLGIEPDVTVDGASLDHVHNPIGAMNENWIASYASTPPAGMRTAFRDVTDRRLAALDLMSIDDWNAEMATPAGPDTYGRFMRIRVFDCWTHEQDIRAALGMPGHESGIAVEVTLDEMSSALGYAVGKLAAAPSGSSVTFDLTGASGRQIHVAIGDRAAVVPALDGPATVTLTMPVVSFDRIACGRLDAPAHRAGVQIDGDRALGEQVLEKMGYTI